jgi:hypothetical protein
MVPILGAPGPWRNSYSVLSDGPLVTLLSYCKKYTYLILFEAVSAIELAPVGRGVAPYPGRRPKLSGRKLRQPAVPE